MNGSRNLLVYVSRHDVLRRCLVIVEVPSVGYHGTLPSRGAFMVICRTRFTLTDSTRSSRHPYSRLLDFPTSWHLYTLGAFTSHGFHGASLDCRHGTILLWTTPVDYSLGPPFGDPSRGRQSGTDVCTVSWGNTLLTHLSQSVSTVMSRAFWCTWVRSDSCMTEWPKFGPTVPFQTPVVMTQGGLVLLEQ